MILSCLFGLRKEQYEGQNAPELLLAWDEYCIEENPEGWETEVQSLIEHLGKEMTAMRIVDIEVDSKRLRDALVKTPELRAQIVGEKKVDF